MRFQLVFKYVATLLFFLSLSYFIPFFYSLWCKDGLFHYYLYPVALTGALFLIALQIEGGELNIKEALLTVSLTWFLFPAISALVYQETGAIKNFIDAYFESVSGFTTTGASILTNIEALPKSVLLWRSTTHWIGGVGFVVFSLSVLPAFGAGGAQLMRFEASKAVEERLVPKVKEMARVILAVYVALTAAEVIALVAAGMPLYDAVNHAFATIATGGFSTKNGSIGEYHSPLIEVIVSFFMLAGATNLLTYYLALKNRSLKAIYSYYEFRSFMAIVAFAVAFTTLVLYFKGTYHSLLEALRFGSFAVISAITTTGFGVADYTKWPPVTQALMMLLEIMGGSSGSTAGGLKQFRIVTMAKTTYYEMKKTLHPRMVYRIVLGKKVVDYSLMNNIWAFISIFFSTTLLFGFLISLSGHDILTSFSASVACITGSGPGLEKVGPAGNFAFFSPIDKLLLSIEMVLGRLEVMSVLTLLLPSFWKE
ncbi:TrkH family potassium uptake protein [Thermovibrio ammonificans]